MNWTPLIHQFDSFLWVPWNSFSYFITQEMACNYILVEKIHTLSLKQIKYFISKNIHFFKKMILYVVQNVIGSGKNRFLQVK